MISYQDFLDPINQICQKDNKFNFEFRFGKIIDDQIFKLELDNINEYISRIKEKNYTFKFMDISFYTDGQNNYYLNKENNDLSMLRNSFCDYKIDLKSLIDIRIIFQTEKKISLEEIPQVNKLFLHGQQEIIFDINSNIKLVIQQNPNITNICIRMNVYNQDDLKIIYELYLYIFDVRT